MAEAGSLHAAEEKDNKIKLQQRYIQESCSSMNDVKNLAESAMFYLNPLTPKWNSEISEKCHKIISEEEGEIKFKSKGIGSRNITRKGATSEEEMTKFKLLKVREKYLVPQTSNRNRLNSLGPFLSTVSEETQDIDDRMIAGRRTFKQMKVLKVQKLSSDQQYSKGICGIKDKCSDNLTSQSEESGIWVCSDDGKTKLEENPKTFCLVTTKLKLQKVKNPILNPNSNKYDEIRNNNSDILLSTLKETKLLVKRDVKTKETISATFKEVTQKPAVQELCSNQQRKQSSNKDLKKCNSYSEIIQSQIQEQDQCESKNNSRECVKDQEEKGFVENKKQVSSKLENLQVEENQMNGIKVSLKQKGQDNSKNSRLLDAMKKRNEMDTEERPFKCPQCHWAFKKLCYLQSHIMTHSGLKPHVCDICGKAYSHQGTLQQHKRLHTGERPYHCPFCDRSYIWSSDYRKHIRTHTGEKPYECKDCGKDFIRSSDLRKHERNMHTNNKPFQCSHCDKTFNRPLSLKRHERKHLGERPFSCPDCGKKFALASRMAEHQKIHKGVRPFVCSVCAKCFTKSSNLTEHEAIHSGKRPHKCEECGVAFAMASRLIRHQYVHNKMKPFTCGGCGRNFKCLKSLEQHQQLNCAGRIFVCVQCDKSFMCAEKLNQHMQHHTDKSGPN